MKKSKIRRILILTAAAVFMAGIVWAIVSPTGALPHTSDGEEPSEAKLATAEKAPSEVFLADLVPLINDGRVVALDVWPERAEATLAEGSKVTVRLAKGTGLQLVLLLKDLGVEGKWFRQLPTDRWSAEDAWFTVVEPIKVTHRSAHWTSYLWVPIALGLAAVMAVSSKKMRTGGVGGSPDPAHGFGKSRARLSLPEGGENPDVSFKDVAGLEEAIDDLAEVVAFLKDPDRFRQMGARMPKGVLLIGSPGTGKTLLAKALAGEAGVPFFSISGSEFVEMFVGVGASRVRDLFEQAKKHSPCIIFLDEIDAVGRLRGGGGPGGHDERDQTLNQILVEMDGFGTDTNVIVVAATNRPDSLDPALVRSGRFDRRVTVRAPDLQARLAILKIHARSKPLDPKIDWMGLASLTAGLVGADLETVLNEAAILAAKNGKDVIGMEEIREGILRLQMGGRACKSRMLTEEDKYLVAYHEAGHAILGEIMRRLGLGEEVELVTIIPRGPSGGSTWFREDDLLFRSRAKLVAQLVTALGGRVAERVTYGEAGVTQGAKGDLMAVRQLAETMVVRLAMADELPPVAFVASAEGFLGGSIARASVSEETLAKIDAAIAKLTRGAQAAAMRLLGEHCNVLDAVALRLMEQETIEAEEFKAMVAELLSPELTISREEFLEIVDAE